MGEVVEETERNTHETWSKAVIENREYLMGRLFQDLRTWAAEASKTSKSEIARLSLFGKIDELERFVGRWMK